MYKIKQAIGYVFEKRKLIITIPVGYSCGNKEMIEKDLSFMKMGAYASLPCEAINIGEANIAYICQMLREKPVNAIIVIENVVDANTEEVLEDLFNKAKAVCDSEKYYMENGYIVKTIFELNECMEEYLTKEDLEHCSILNIDASKFNLRELLLEANNKLKDIRCFSKVRKSKLVNHIFVEELDEIQNENIDNIVNHVIHNNLVLAIPYMYSEEENYFGMNSIEGNIDLSKIDLEDEEEYYNLFGEIDINSESIVSYLIYCNNEIINIKIIYYKGITQGCQRLYEIAEEVGALKKKMESYLNNYIFDDDEKIGSAFNLNSFKVYKKDFDLIGFIAKVSENLGWAAEMSYFVSCLQRDSKGNFDGIGNCQEDLTDIIPFMEETSDNSIFVPIAVSDLDGEVILAHGKNIKEDEFDLGSVTLDEDTIVGLIISIVDNKYKFIIAEHSACIGQYEVIKECGDFNREVIRLINKFIKRR